MSPSGVHALVEQGHTVPLKIKITKMQDIVSEQSSVWDVEMVIKVKEPLEEEYKYFKEGLILFTYLHLANEEKLTQALVDNKVVGIAYETVQLPDRSLPLLTPMSEVAGRMSAQVGSQFLQNLTVEWVFYLEAFLEYQKVKVDRAKIALGLGANVTILDVNPKRLVN